MPILVDETSKLYKALKLHTDVLEYIISLSPHEFVRLRNPVWSQNTADLKLLIGKGFRSP